MKLLYMLPPVLDDTGSCLLVAWLMASLVSRNADAKRARRLMIFQTGISDSIT
jgi:hypothetical protein